MSVLITSITELSQNFFHADPLKFNEYFAITPDYQKYCSNTCSCTRFTITLVKQAMLIHDITIHLLAGGVKLTTGAVKGICAIASGILSLETDHQTPSKQAVVHFGFAVVYTADIFASITNINKTYPQHLMDKAKDAFTDFLKVPNKRITIKYIADPEIEKALKKKQAEAEEKELALQEEQRKAKEQEKLLKMTQQELKDIRDSDFISEEELQEISKEAKKVADTPYCEEASIEEPIAITTSFIIDGKLGTNFHQYKLTYDNSDDDALSIQEDDGNLWFEDEFSKDEIVIEKEEEEKSPIEIKKPAILETKKITSQKKVIKSPKKKIFSNSNPSQISARNRGLEYAKELRNRSKKTLVG